MSEALITLNKREAEQIIASLRELSAHEEDFDWGPTQEFAEERQREAIQCLRNKLALYNKSTHHQDTSPIVKQIITICGGDTLQDVLKVLEYKLRSDSTLHQPRMILEYGLLKYYSKDPDYYSPDEEDEDEDFYYQLVSSLYDQDTATLEGILKLLGGVKYQNVVSDELVKELEQVSKPAIFSFGKHKGQSVKEVSTEYLGWCVENLQRCNIKEEIRLEYISRPDREEVEREKLRKANVHSDYGDYEDDYENGWDALDPNQ